MDWAPDDEFRICDEGGGIVIGGSHFVLQISEDWVSIPAINITFLKEGEIGFKSMSRADIF